jgi:Zn-dependent peptidase ImmA (M78 family)
MSLGGRRVTIAHELGHIFLGHEVLWGRGVLDTPVRKPRSETDADMFALRLLAPACVLWGLDLHTPEEIAAACQISAAAARRRADRMRVLYKRQNFLASAMEKKLFSQFKDFIYSRRNGM